LFHYFSLPSQSASRLQEEKIMKKEEAKKLGEDALAELANQLAAGKSEELIRFLDAMSSFHDYSWGNCMLIVMQRPTATLVAGFQAWRKHGRFVKKGEKGICILAPMVGKKEDEHGNEASEVFGFRAVHVFDVSQTEGEELPDLHRVAGEPGEKLLLLHRAVETFGIRIAYDEHLNGADGVSKGGEIALLEGLSPAVEFNTLAHEVAHEMLHRGPDRPTLSKTVKELEAEAVAYVVSKAAGLTGGLKHSADYIQCHAGDKEQLGKSLDRIRRTSSQILEALEAARSEPLSEVA